MWLCPWVCGHLQSKSLPREQSDAIAKSIFYQYLEADFADISNIFGMSPRVEAHPPILQISTTRKFLPTQNEFSSFKQLFND